MKRVRRTDFLAKAAFDDLELPKLCVVQALAQDFSSSMTTFGNRKSCHVLPERFLEDLLDALSRRGVRKGLENLRGHIGRSETLSKICGKSSHAAKPSRKLAGSRRTLRNPLENLRGVVARCETFSRICGESSHAAKPSREFAGSYRTLRSLLENLRAPNNSCEHPCKFCASLFVVIPTAGENSLPYRIRFSDTAKLLCVHQGYNTLPNISIIHHE